jgi:hypothetical protein
MKSQNQDIILDTNKELDELERELRGMVKTENGYVLDPTRRQLSDKGVNDIMSRLRIPFSKIGVLSNLSEDQIKDEATDFNIWLAYDFSANEEHWGIEERYTDRSSLIMRLSWIFFNLLMRSKNALQLKQLSESIERHEKVIYGDQQQKEKWWEFWKSK